MSAATALEKVRAFCLSLPETEEKLAWGAPTFRVRGRLFVMFENNHHKDGRIALWCNAPEGAQKDLVAADPKNFFVPPYVGVGGWIGVRLDQRLKWSAVAAVIQEAYRTTVVKLDEKKRRSKRARAN